MIRSGTTARLQRSTESNASRSCCGRHAGALLPVALASVGIAATHYASADPFRLTFAEDDAVPLQLPAQCDSLKADVVELEPYAIGGSDFNGMTVVAGGVGVNWFAADHVSVGVFAELMHVNQVGDNGVGAGGGVLLRWHFLEREDMSVFAEVGIGFIAFDHPVPDIATSFDFSPRAAVGARWQLDADTMFTARIGWLHLSNAQTGEENPGVDVLAVTLGLRFEF